MAVGYLVTVLLAAIPTFFAVFAPHPSRVIAQTTFRLSMAINEAPFYPLVWVLFWSATTAAGGAFGRLANLPGLVIAALTVVGLLVIAARGLGTPTALGSGGGAELRSSRLRLLGALLVPGVYSSSRDVRCQRNVSYGPAGQANLLDLYLPRHVQPHAGVLVHFHGGAFSSGVKSRESRLLLHRFASHGWVCASANYRLQPAATFEEQLADAQAAVRRARELAEGQGVRSTRLILVGCSAGAYLSANVAAAGQNNPVTAVVGLGGYYGNDIADPAGPAALLAARTHTATPAFFIAHGSHDTFVPVERARAFARALDDGIEAPVSYAELPGGQHSFDLFRSPRFTAVVDSIQAFIDQAA